MTEDFARAFEAESWGSFVERIPDEHRCKFGSWTTYAEREVIFRELKYGLKGGDTFVEIGVAGGATLAIAAAVCGPGVTIYGIDDWSNQSGADGGPGCDPRSRCLHALDLVGGRGRVTLLDEPSQQAGVAWTRYIDFLIIDGDHTYAAVLKDLQLFARWVPEGGLLLADDYSADDGDVRLAVSDWLTKEPASRWQIESLLSGDKGKHVAYRRRGKR